MKHTFRGVYDGARVLVTGHTGFKGGWLSLWLRMLGAEVVGLALDPPSERNVFDAAGLSSALAEDARVDVRDRRGVRDVADRARPDFVFHMAAQSLVRPSYTEPVETFATNVMGTVHVLEALRELARPCTVVIVTSDKCYAPDTAVQPYVETTPLGGHDPYSSSKAAAEIATAAYRQSFFGSTDSPVRVASARAGNVIGGGDYATDRIVPDIVRAIEADKPVTLRNPASVRPWQHVLDPLSGYLWLAAQLSQGTSPAGFAEAWNFGPNESMIVTVRDLAERIIAAWGKGTYDIAGADPSAPSEAHRLLLSCAKAHSRLAWRQTYDLDAAIGATVAWYRAAAHAGAKSADLQALTGAQIDHYVAAATAGHAAWTTTP